MQQHTDTDKEKLERRARYFVRYLETNGIMPPKDVLVPVAMAYARIVSFFAGDAGVFKPRGFLLSGPTGCGKTTLVRAIKDCCNVHMRKRHRKGGFVFARARRLCEDYVADDDFLSRLRDVSKRNAVIIDDLGIESPVSRYGAPWGLEHYIEDRYDTWEELGFPTLITTNYQRPENILQRYGERAMSRLIGMVDFIPYQHADRRIAQNRGYNSIREAGK